MGVKPFYKRFKHNGVNGPNMATVYSDRGHGVRAPVVFYNRFNEAGALLEARRFRLEGDLRGGVRWFHSGGIRGAFGNDRHRRGHAGGEGTGAVISFDLNYREKLGNLGGQGAPAGSSRVLWRTWMCWSARRICRGLGVAGSGRQVQVVPQCVLRMIEKVVKGYRRIKVVVTTLREHSTSRSIVGARWPGLTGKPISLRLVIWTSTIA